MLVVICRVSGWAPGDEQSAAMSQVTDADRQRALARIEEMAGLSAPNARIAAREVLAARDVAGIGDDVRPPPPLAPEALREVRDELISEKAAPFAWRVVRFRGNDMEML